MPTRSAAQRRVHTHATRSHLSPRIGCGARNGGIIFIFHRRVTLRYGVLMSDESLHDARKRGTDHPRRRPPADASSLTGTRAGDSCACTRPVAACIVLRGWSVPAAPFQRRSTAAPNNVRKTRSSSDDLLLLLGRQLLAIQSIVSRSVMVRSASIMEFCGCTTPLYGRCGTAAELTASDPSLVQLASS